MRLKDIRGLPVIDPTAARRIGTVSDYQVDPASGRLAGLDVACIDGGGGADERVLAQRIRRVGSNAVILTARGGAAPGTAPELNDHWLDTSTLVGLEVMGDDGNRIGHLVDAVFDQDTLEIEAYLLRASFFERLIGRRGRIQPAKVHACSRELMMVMTGQVKAAEIAPEDTAPLDTAPREAEVEVRMPLKPADRLAMPTYEPVAPVEVEDGQPAGARPR